jgi:hypothetical protein
MARHGTDRNIGREEQIIIDEKINSTSKINNTIINRIHSIIIVFYVLYIGLC